ncbi:Putative esterase [Spirosomataceae bacterium TFI 002]|nr:Putative esterase [Spirosomataceae bacterium TFI 002]
MKKNIILLLLFVTYIVNGQSSKLIINVKTSPELTNNQASEGRLMLFLNQNPAVDPKDGTWPMKKSRSIIFAKNISTWKGGTEINSDAQTPWQSTEVFGLNDIPKGKYYLQVLYAQSKDESRIDVPGDLYSKPVLIDLTKNANLDVQLTEKVANRSLIEHKLVQDFTQQSQALSNWWSKPMSVKASILLPSGYFENPDKRYPVRYNVAGYGGRYDRINRLLKQEEFKTWWESDNAPQVITVFLDGEGPFGDSYQLDSDNNGPFGQNLVEELIPTVEKLFRTNGKRYTDGCSTGGWVSLALQLFYPKTFDACYSYSPDPVDFSDMQLMNIYNDENAFISEFGLDHPSKRSRDGEPEFTVRQEINYENIQGKNSTWTTSGQQWGGWNAVYSPNSKDGTPTPLFDPKTGNIDKSVAENWKKYDLLKLVQDNWSTLGPQIQGKVNIVMGDMDNYYLNNALRKFDSFIKTTESPKSDANIIFKATEGHCDSYSHRKVLEQIGELN